MKKSCAILVLFLLPAILHSPQTVYITEGNIFDGKFSSPVEALYIICFDGYFYRISTGEANRVDVSAHYLKTFLGERGYALKDVAIMMHNHFAMPAFSWGDTNILLKLRGYGFRGSFGIYITSTERVIYEKPWLKGK